MAKRKVEDGTASTSTKKGKDGAASANPTASTSTKGSNNKKNGTTSINTFTIAKKLQIIREWDVYMNQQPKPTPDATAERFKHLGTNFGSIRRRMNEWKSKESVMLQVENKSLKTVPATINCTSSLSKTLSPNTTSNYYPKLTEISKQLCTPEGIQKIMKNTNIKKEPINGAIQVALDENNIDQLNSTFRIDMKSVPQYIIETMKGENTEVTLDEAKLLIQETGDISAQTTHCDMPNQIQHKGDIKLFSANGISGIMLLHEASHPKVYKTDDVKLPVSPDDVYTEMGKFETVPDELKEAISGNEHLMNYLSNYGIVLFANSTNRPSKPNLGNAHEITIFESNQPHFGPGTADSQLDFRLTVFFTMSMGIAKTKYDDSQCSREKLVFEMIKGTQDVTMCEECFKLHTYLYRYMSHVLIDLAKYGGDIDCSIDVKGWKEFDKLMNRLVYYAKQHFKDPANPQKKDNFELLKSAVEVYGINKLNRQKTPVDGK